MFAWLLFSKGDRFVWTAPFDFEQRKSQSQRGLGIMTDVRGSIWDGAGDQPKAEVFQVTNLEKISWKIFIQLPKYLKHSQTSLNAIAKKYEIKKTLRALNRSRRVVI